MGPLHGIRVIEMAVAVQGPGAGGYLAEMGADVIKVEPPWGDGNRFHRGVANNLPSGTLGTQFIGVSSGKRSVAIDVHSPLGKGLAYRLIDGADVFLSNYREGALERMGMGYETLAARNSKLVYGIANGYGHKGPAANKRMTDQFAQSRSGIASVTGEPGRPPIIPGAIIGDTAGAIQLAMGIVLALFARQGLGAGQKVSVSSYGALIWMQGWEINHTSLTGHLLTKDGPHHPNVPGPVGIYETADGEAYCVSFPTQAVWQAFCEYGGIAEVLGDERWDSVEKRSGLRNAAEAESAALLRPHVARGFKSRPAAEWDAFFAANPDIVEQRVLDYRGVLDDPQAIENGYIVEKDIPHAGRYKVVGIPVQLSRTPGAPQPLFAELGEHTEVVMAELGYSDGEIAALAEETRNALANRYL